jgi:hypothetical protein
MEAVGGWMVVVSLFGLWALCEQRVDDLGERSPRAAWPRICSSAHRRRGRVARGRLALEGFVQLSALSSSVPAAPLTIAHLP